MENIFFWQNNDIICLYFFSNCDILFSWLNFCEKSNLRWRIVDNLAPCSCAGAVEYSRTLLHHARRKTRPCHTLHPPIANKPYQAINKSVNLYTNFTKFGRLPTCLLCIFHTIMVKSGRFKHFFVKVFHSAFEIVKIMVYIISTTQTCGVTVAQVILVHFVEVRILTGLPFFCLFPKIVSNP